MNAPATRPGAAPGRFTTGSTFRHVAVMTGTASIGLIAIFMVDFLSLFYISRLNDDRLTAGVGYATTILFVAISVNIGAMIAGSALVARLIGAGETDRARRMASDTLVLSALIGIGVSAGLLLAMAPLLTALGAKGTAYDVAIRFLWITLPANVLMAIGMGFSGLLRAVGDASRAMKVTLYGGVVTAGLDPLLIFGFGLGTDGAAYATVIARMVYVAVGYAGIVGVHRLVARPRLAGLGETARPFFAIAVPAILTNVASPIGNLFFLRVLAPFGASAIAASAILDRLVPLAFGVLFALSGAIGPILAQNLGARQFDRVRAALRDGLVFALAYSALAWALLALFRNEIPAVFSVEGDTARYVAFFCLIGGVAWVFNGFLFVANASFNNLGFPLYSTAFNWGRATLGTVPPAMLGASLAGVEGAMVGLIAGSAFFGLFAVWVAFRSIEKLASRAPSALP